MPEWRSILQEFQVPAPEQTIRSRAIPILVPRPKAILFDVYGTLVSPLLGDLEEQARLASGEDSFIAAAERFGYSREVGIRWHKWFFEAIASEHQELKEKGVTPAEVQVDQIWAAMIRRSGGDPAITQPRAIAAYREMLANPVRAFAGAAEVLQELKANRIRLGIVSNSQFYTMPILGMTLGFAPDEIFDAELTFLSYRLGFAKPSPYFFRLVRTTVMRMGLQVEEALIVGNDCKNDILAAEAHGLRALLFYGNDQSVRLGRVGGGDAVITTYESLLTACGLNPNIS
jgi:putative hydrolase of the HAD superfamily